MEILRKGLWELLRCDWIRSCSSPVARLGEVCHYRKVRGKYIESTINRCEFRNGRKITIDIFLERSIKACEFD